MTEGVGGILGGRPGLGLPARPRLRLRPCRLPQSGYTLDADTKLFFALGNAMMDASIAAWHQKYKWDFVRPITAIRERYRGQTIQGWKGPSLGFGAIQGENWIPYQATNVVTPGFPEYVSGHSTFSGAGMAILS